MLDPAIAFRMIERAAELGEPCPTNPEICRALGSSSRATGSRIVFDLEKQGLIRVQRGNCRRIVTIIATGKKTAGEIRDKHWRLGGRTGGHAARPIKPEVALIRVERDPCPRCGVRRDIGCPHRPSDRLSVCA